jgi:hypothetical protein
MLHALGFVTGDPTIRISYPFVFHPGVQITVSEPGNAKWVYMMLPLPKGSLIERIHVAHHRSGIQSGVTHIRLVQQKEPMAAEVLYDNPVEQEIPSHHVISFACSVVVESSVLLNVCMEFTSSDDMIEFGSVEVQYIPDYEKKMTSDEGDKKRKEEKLIYTSNKKHSEKNRPTLVDMFFQSNRKKTISNNRTP